MDKNINKGKHACCSKKCV